MNAPKVSAAGYIQILLASLRVVSGTEAARMHPNAEAGPAHDAFTRLLHRLMAEPGQLWSEVWRQVERRRGVPVRTDERRGRRDRVFHRMPARGASPGSTPDPSRSNEVWEAAHAVGALPLHASPQYTPTPPAARRRTPAPRW